MVTVINSITQLICFMHENIFLKKKLHHDKSYIIQRFLKKFHYCNHLIECYFESLLLSVCNIWVEFNDSVALD